MVDASFNLNKVFSLGVEVHACNSRTLGKKDHNFEFNLVYIELLALNN